MARLGLEKLSLPERRRRRFSDNFKLEKVRSLEMGRVTVVELCKQYTVSATSVYRWIDKFGLNKDETERLVVETKSDTQELLALKKKVAELEQIVGQKQILIDFKDKMIDIAEEMYGIEIKKKRSTKRSNTSGKTKGKTPSV